MTVCAVTIPMAQAGVMHEDVHLRTYTDFGQNRGRYVVGTSVNALLEYIRSDVDKGIVIQYTDGTEPYTISNEQGMINFTGTNDNGAQVVISPTFAATVLHNGSINASYGIRVVGDEHAINYTAIDVRGSDVFRLAPDNGNGNQYDYMLQRQSKIATDAVWNPVTSISDMDLLDGQLLYHSGAGTMGIWREESGKSGLAEAYQFIIGGINNITNAETHVSGDATNTSVHQNPGYGDGVGASLRNPLPNAIQGGDSGSPVFIYNTETGQYEYLAAQQSGGGNSYCQARGDVVWTHATLAEFDKNVKTDEQGLVKLGAINTAGDTHTDNNGLTTQVYSGVATDTDGNVLANYRGVKSGLSTWSDLSDIKDLSNWYAYENHLAQPITDLFFNDNLVITAGTAQNTIELQDTVDLGVGYVEFHRGEQQKAVFNITAKGGADYLLNSAGYVVNEGAEVHISFTNPDDHMYEWRKNGAGDLYIEGSGNTNALLTVGGSGTTYLKRTDGYAAYNVLVSSGSTVVIDNVQQIKRSFTFGAGGGTLDMNGNSMGWYSSTTGDGYFTINALTEQAMIVNNADTASELTFCETGEQKYVGSWRDSATGALRINYNGGGIWELNSIHTNLQNHESSGLTVSSGTVRLVGTHTVHGMGSESGRNANRLVVENDWHYADAAMDVAVEDGATFELGSHARLSGDVTVASGGSFVMREGVQNRYEYVEGGVFTEDTYKYREYYGLKGDVALESGASMRVEYSEGIKSDSVYSGDITGLGNLSVNLGNSEATFTLEGDSTFSGTKLLVAGGLISTGKNSLGDTSENKWQVEKDGWIASHAESGSELLSRLDTSSTGTLALSADTTEQLDFSRHTGLYLGAEAGRKVQYGAAGTSEELTAVDGAWRLGGGGGELVVNYLLSGQSDLLLGAFGQAPGTVHLANSSNNFTGKITYNSSGIKLTYAAGALGESSVVLTYGNGVLLQDSADVVRIHSDSDGILLADNIAGKNIDMSPRPSAALGVSADTVYTGNITLATDAGYRFSAMNGASFTIGSALDSTQNLVVDAQGLSGSKVILVGNESWSGGMTVQGHRDGDGTGEITLALGRDMEFSGTLMVKQGGVLDIAGHKLTLQESLASQSGHYVDTMGTGSLVFDTSEKELSSSACLDMDCVRKTGQNTLVLGGQNAMSHMYVDSGTLALGGDNVFSGSAIIHLSDGTVMDNRSHALDANVMLESGTAELGSSNYGYITVRGNVELAGGTRLNLASGKNVTLTGAVHGGSGATLAVNGGTLNLSRGGNVDLAGTLLMQGEAVRLESRGGAENMERNFENLQVGGGKLTLWEESWNTLWNIDSVSGSGELYWHSHTTHSKTSRLVLGGDGGFTGIITLYRTFDNTDRTHGAFIELASDTAAKNASVNLLGIKGINVNAVASLAVNTENAHIKGLSGNSYSFVYAGISREDAALSGTDRPETTRAATLTIDTDADTSYTYSGTLGNTTDTVTSGLSLVKTGAGTQIFEGPVTLGNVSVEQGTLQFGSDTALNRIGIHAGATLVMPELILEEGMILDIGGGSGSGSAAFTGNLVIDGGELSCTSDVLLRSREQGVAVLNITGGVEMKTGHLLSITDYASLLTGEYTLATGDWSAVQEQISGHKLGYFDATFGTNASGHLVMTLTLTGDAMVWAGADAWRENNFDGSGRAATENTIAVFDDSSANKAVQVDTNANVAQLEFNSAGDYSVTAQGDHTVNTTDLVQMGHGTTTINSGVQVSGDTQVVNGTLVVKGTGILNGTVGGSGTLDVDWGVGNKQNLNLQNMEHVQVTSGTLQTDISCLTGTESIAVARDGELSVDVGSDVSFLLDIQAQNGSFSKSGSGNLTWAPASGSIELGTLGILSGSVELAAQQAQIHSVTGSGKLIMNSSGELSLTNVGLANLTLLGGGTTNFNGTASISDHLSIGLGTVNLNEGALVSAYHYTSGNTGSNQASYFVINQGASLEITGSTDTDATANSFLLAHWKNSSSALVLNGGSLKSVNTRMLMGWDSGGRFEALSGEATLKGILFSSNRGNADHFVLGEARINIGTGGITGFGTNDTVQLGNGTVAAMADFDISGAGVVNLAGTTSGTTFDTDRYTITVASAMSGAGNFTKSGEGTLVLNGSFADFEGSLSVNNGTVELGSSALDIFATASAVNLNGGMLNISSAGFSAEGEGMALKNLISAKGGALAFGALESGTVYNIFTGDTVTEEWWSSMQKHIVVNGAALSRYEGASLTVSGNTAQLYMGSGTLQNLDIVWDSSATSGEWNNFSTSWKDSSTDGNVSFADGDNVTFASDAQLTLSTKKVVQNFTLKDGVTLSTHGALSITGTISVGENVSWSLSGSTEVSMSEETIGKFGKLELGEGAILTMTGLTTGESNTSSSFDKVSGAGKVVLNLAANNGVGFNLSGITGDIEVATGRLQINTSTFSEGSSIHLAASDSQLVFNGTDTELKNDVVMEILDKDSAERVGVIHVNDKKTGTISGVISGAADFEKKGAGALTFATQNTYTGQTTISDGRLILDTGAEYTLKGRMIGSGTLEVAAGTTLVNKGREISAKLELAQGASAQLSGEKMLKGNIVVNSGSTLSFTGTASDTLDYGATSKSITVDGGTVDFGATRQTMGSWEVVLKNNATLTGSGGTYSGSSYAAALDFNADSTIITESGTENSIASNIRLRGGNDRTLTFRVDEDACLDVSGRIHADGDDVLGNIIKSGEGSLSLSGESKLNSIKTLAGEVVIAGTGEAGIIVNSVDASMNNGTTANGTLRIAEYAKLEIKSNLWSRPNTGIRLEQGAELNMSGKGVVFTHYGSGEASLAATEDGTGYALNSTAYQLSNGHVSYTASTDATINNILKDSSVENAGSGVLKVNNSANKLTGVHATGGDIKLFSMEKLSLEQLEAANSVSVSAYTGVQEQAAQEACISVSRAASFGTGVTLNADLVMKSGSALNMDGVVKMGSDVSLETGLTLGGAQLEAVKVLKAGEKVTLFSGIDALYLGDSETASEAITLDDQVLASVYFENLSDDYFLIYDTTVLNEHELSIAMVPEPTTATLSIMALAALAFRRRRK